MRPKTIVIKRKKSTGIIMTATLMLVSILVIIAFAFQAYGAGAPKASTKKSKSAAEKRAEANTYFDQGEQFQDQENYKEAARKYEKAVKADPNYAEAHSNLGFSYRKQGKFNQAVRSYKKAISLSTWAKPMPRWENLSWRKKNCKFCAIWDLMKPMSSQNLLIRRRPAIDVSGAGAPKECCA
jgi:tetratricopeptide (TPR) repeat protein